jgi:hypothetical protein
MTIDEARELFAYSAWANGRMLGAAEALTAPDRGDPAQHGSHQLPPLEEVEGVATERRGEEPAGSGGEVTPRRPFHWKGRACKGYTRVQGKWLLIFHTGLLEYAGTKGSPSTRGGSL